jgi:prepilin-type N-terminal cleavage/methylation domain-containing protein
MSKLSASLKSGFTLIEMVTSLAILGILVAALVPLATSIVDGQRAASAETDLTKIYTAIVGQPSQNTYGYLGDVGTYPSSLLDLVQLPGSNPPGWNGPYLSDARIDTGVIYDAFGSPVEYFQTSSAAGDQLAIISRGPDRTSTNTAASPNSSVPFIGVLPSSGTYSAGANNADNVVYPHFMDNTNLASYQDLGTLNVNIMNFDDNPTVSALMPACPNYYDVAIASVPRGGNEAYVTFNPGGASFDLVQGLYIIKVFVTATTNQIWQEQVSIKPGDTTSRTLSLSGVNSSLFGTTTLTAVGSSGTTLQYYHSGISSGAGVVSPTTAGPYTVNKCERITVRETVSNTPFDAFIQPNFAYTKHYQSGCSMSFTNATYKTIAIYDDGLLIGTVGRRGNKKTKSFTVHKNEIISVKDETNTTRNGNLGGATYTVVCPALNAVF